MFLPQFIGPSYWGPFDLLSLPNVARHKVFSFMPIKQLLAISKTSERCKTAIKFFKFDVKLSAHEGGLEVLFPGDRFCIPHQIGSGNAIMNEKEWRDSITEITRLYGQSLNSLQTTTRNFDGIWEWINEEQSGLKRLVLTVKNPANPLEVIKTILNNPELKQLKELYFNMETSGTFKYTDPFIFKKPPKHLEISNSSWFTVQHLMDCQVEMCQLAHSKLTDEDFNVILKNWKNQVDALKNLKLLLVYRLAHRYTNIDVVYNGLQREKEFHGNGYSDIKLTYDHEFYFELTVSRDYLCIEKKSRIHPLY